jgi:hypothetical protein
MRGGSKDGIAAHVRGWKIGVEVLVHENENGEEEVIVAITGGSDNPTSRQQIHVSAVTKKIKMFDIEPEFQILIPEHSDISLVLDE